MNKKVYKQNGYQVKMDNELGYYHLFPLPSKNELKKYYEQEFYEKNYAGQKNDSYKEVKQEEEDEFIEIRCGDILEIINKEAKGKKIIDIGCGYGNFLGFCHKNGYEATGVEPGRQAVEYIKNKFNLSVYQTNIEDFVKMTKEKYHVAVLLDVLEHMREPYKILTDVRDNILEDEGILVVRTPNEFNKLQLIANQEYRLKNWWISAPQHINYFTIAHLEKLITNCGYEVFLKEAAFPLEMFILFGDQ